MKKLFFFLAAFFTIGTLLAQPTITIIRHISIIDLVNGGIARDRTVIIEGNKIKSISGKAASLKGAVIIDGTGKYLIPGLWDMHIHALTDNRYEWVFPLLIANGVTGIRELGNNLEFARIRQIRQDVLDGKIVGPRIGATTERIFDGTLGTSMIANVAHIIDSTNEARQWVRKYKQEGMDFVKVYNLLSKEVYLAIIDEAKKQHIPVAGHVPFCMTAAEVSDLGQTTIEHSTDIIVSCSAEEKKLRQELDALPQNSPPMLRQPIEIRALSTFDETKARGLFQQFAKKGTWICPTTVLYVGGTVEDSARLADERLKYISAQTRERWASTLKQRSQTVTIDERRVRFQKRIQITGLMHRSGVKLLAGSDAVNPYVYPGFSVPEELELLVQSGLTPLESLQTATINAAKFLNKEKELGTVEKGKFADLLLLDANPLENISNVKKIHAVIVNGKIFQRPDLQKLLAGVEEGAKNK